MSFNPHTVYHVYNQGNNHELIFPREENYLFFLGKMRALILPYADFLAYCLMPNHFHWLLYAREEACVELDFSLPGEARPHFLPRQRLCHQINILLRSYTRGINKQEGRTGSLFRAHTKAKDGWSDDWISLTKRNSTKLDRRFSTDNDYALQCFNYIHENPVKANMVLTATDWMYSSARDYAGLRNGTLCNQILAKELLRL